MNFSSYTSRSKVLILLSIAISCYFIDQKPFECDQCDQSFRQRQLLKRHQNLYHNPNYVPPEPKVDLFFMLKKSIVCILYSNLNSIIFKFWSFSKGKNARMPSLLSVISSQRKLNSPHGSSWSRFYSKRKSYCLESWKTKENTDNWWYLFNWTINCICIARKTFLVFMKID